MRKSVSTPFFPSQGYSMFDFWAFSSGGAVNAVTWTAGRTATRQAILGGPSGSQHWRLISVSVQAYLRWVWDNSNNLSVYGKLGKILCGLSMDQALPTQPGDSYSLVALEMPTDTSLLTVMWDPVTDAMPPIVVSGAGPSVPAVTPSTSLVMNSQISPPNPLDLYPGVSPTVGIWMMPSLLGLLTLSGTGGIPNGIGLDLGMARFTINYDDGLG